MMLNIWYVASFYKATFSITTVEMATHKVLKYFVVAITLCSTCVSEGAIAFQVGLTDKLNAPLSANLDMRKFNQEVMQLIQQQVDYKFKQEGRYYCCAHV